MCTCDPDFPEGNPYYGCAECLFDQHCRLGEGSRCVNRTCVAPARVPSVPPEYVRVGRKHYLVSGDELPWPQVRRDRISVDGGA